ARHRSARRRSLACGFSVLDSGLDQFSRKGAGASWLKRALRASLIAGRHPEGARLPRVPAVTRHEVTRPRAGNHDAAGAKEHASKLGPGSASRRKGRRDAEPGHEENVT